MSGAKPTITLSGTRGEEWERVLGTRTFAIVDPEPAECNLDGQGLAQCVMLDVIALHPDQQDALITYLAKKSGALRTAVRRDVYDRGVPIRIGADARIDVPAGYSKRRRMLNGPTVFDPRFF